LISWEIWASLSLVERFAATSIQELVVHPFDNLRRLFRGMRHAFSQPEVQGGAQLVVTLIVIATIFYRTVEGWSWLDAVYFSVVTIATVGYGDITPQTAIGKVFTIGYIFSGIGIFVAAATALAQAMLQAKPPHEDRHTGRR
jgi:voltage-gated potassium channel